MKTTKLLLLLVTTFTLTLTSCKKDEETNTGTIIVATVFEDGSTSAGVTVELYDEIGGSTIGTKTTGSDGKVTFNDILEGTYEVDAWNDDYSSSDDPSFQLIGGQTKTVNLTLIED